MRRFRPRLTYANAMSTIAVFVALGGGAYAAVSTIPASDGIIHGCYKKHRGSLRLVPRGRRCARSENAIAFRETGRPGLRGSAGRRGVKGLTGAAGPAGAAAAPGARGEQGPAGPGASSFATSIHENAETPPLATLANGITVTASCSGSAVSVSISASGPARLQVSGTASEGKAVEALDTNDVVEALAVGAAQTVDVDVIARDSAFSKFERIDVHAQAGSPDCPVWGMLTPSS
jgi:hypothetical protein